MSLAFEIAPNFFHHVASLAQLVDAGNHWKHDPDIALGARAKERPELHLEQRSLLETETNGAQSQSRVELAVGAGQSGNLVAPEIKGAECDEFAVHPADHAPRVLELLFFTGQIAAIEV